MDPVQDPTMWGTGPQQNALDSQFNFFDTDMNVDALSQLFSLNDDGSTYVDNVGDMSEASISSLNAQCATVVADPSLLDEH